MKIEIPINLGDTVYYVLGTDNPTIDKGKVTGVEHLASDDLVRIVVDMENSFRFRIRADILGTDLFINEEEAKAEQKRRREENSMPNRFKQGSKRI